MRPFLPRSCSCNTSACISAGMPLTARYTISAQIFDSWTGTDILAESDRSRGLARARAYPANESLQLPVRANEGRVYV